MAVIADLRIGCCGLPLSLARYCEIFPVVEVQQTFYQPPQPRTLEKWRQQSPPEFEFTLKAWQLITHEASSPTYRRLREKLSAQQKLETGAFRATPTVMNAWRRTLECANLLQSRVILFQCPARFGPTKEHKANLRAFFQGIRRQKKLPGKVDELVFAWEPRGDWKPGEIKELCEELDLVHAVDPFQQRPVTSGLGYFRLHGRTGYRYSYTDSDFHELLDMTQAHSPCCVLFNNISMREDARKFLSKASRPEKGATSSE